jgi:hypothetical protein
MMGAIDLKEGLSRIWCCVANTLCPPQMESGNALIGEIVQVLPPAGVLTTNDCDQVYGHLLAVEGDTYPDPRAPSCQYASLMFRAR